MYRENQDSSKKAENVILFLGHYISIVQFLYFVSGMKISICEQEKNGCNSEDNGRSAKC